MQTPQPLNVPNTVYLNAGQSAVSQNQITTDRKRVAGYSCKAARATGIIQCICGLAALIFGIAIVTITWSSNINAEYFDRIGSGIWAGVIFIITGALGLASSSKNRALIVSYLVMSVISSVVAAAAIIIIALGILADLIYTVFSSLDWNESARVVNLVFNVLLIFVLLVEGIAAIIGSAIGCCSGLCCNGQSQGIIQERVVYVAVGNPMANMDIQQPSYPMAPPAYVPAPSNLGPEKEPPV